MRDSYAESYREAMKQLGINPDEKVPNQLLNVQAQARAIDKLAFKIRMEASAGRD
jgi:hypothetical protein